LNKSIIELNCEYSDLQNKLNEMKVKFMRKSDENDIKSHPDILKYKIS